MRKRIFSRLISGLLIIAMCLSMAQSATAAELADSETVETEWTETEPEEAETVQTAEMETIYETETVYETESEETETVYETEALYESEAEKTELVYETEDVYQTGTGEENIFATEPYIEDDGNIEQPNPGHTLSVFYELLDTDQVVAVEWQQVNESGEILAVLGDSESCVIPMTAAESWIQVQLTITDGANAGMIFICMLQYQVGDVYENPQPLTEIIEPLENGINVYLAGDSTVRDYSESGIYSQQSYYTRGSWGEFLSCFFEDHAVQINNYANSRRSTRSFINEGSLDKIASTIGKGDYLFIQFGHNDEKITTDAMVPVGEADDQGIYPVTKGMLSVTPDSLAEQYGPLYYSESCGGTFKWFLSQYVETALAAEAIPVLVTPVTRFAFDDTGKIIPNHDLDSATVKNNAYVEAIRQLYQEYKDKGVEIYLLDAYDITVELYEEAYAAEGSDAVKRLFDNSDTVHASKIGGMIQALALVQLMQESGMPLADYLIEPSGIVMKNNKGKTEFEIDLEGVFLAFQRAGSTVTSQEDSYWTKVAQNLLDLIIPESVDTVTTLSVKATDQGFLLSWDYDSHARGYYIYRRLYDGKDQGDWKRIAVLEKGYMDSWKDEDTQSGVCYEYVIRAYNELGIGQYMNKHVVKICYLDCPTVRAANASNGLLISWDKIRGAKGYCIYRKESSSNTWKRIKTISGGSIVNWVDQDAISGVVYDYTVRAYRETSLSAFVEDCSVLFLKAPTVNASNTSQGIKISWTVSKGASGYYIYRSEYDGTKWGKWSSIGKTGGVGNTSYEDTEIAVNKLYRYTVRAYNGTVLSSFQSGAVLYRLTEPVFSLTKVSKGIKIDWKQCQGASGYYIYRKTSPTGAWTRVKTVSASSACTWTDTNVKKGATYYYTVRAYKGAYTSSFYAGKGIVYK